MNNITQHKKFLIWKDYGELENWGLVGETENWDDAIVTRETALANGSQGEVLITEFCPIICFDGRSKNALLS